MILVRTYFFVTLTFFSTHSIYIFPTIRQHLQQDFYGVDVQKKFKAIIWLCFACFYLKLLVLKKSEKLKNRGVWFDTDVPMDI